MSSRRGLLLTLEGIDGTGKTTQAGLLVEFLRRSGFPVVATREPGGTSTGEKLRQLLLETDHELPPETEALLYSAARFQLVRDVILPAIRAGSLVVVDRFIDSTLAYQGYGSGVSLDALKWLNEFVLDEAYPDLTLLFDVEPEVSLKAAFSAPDRIERKGPDYRRRVREGYLELARAEPARFRIINAGRGAPEVIWGDVEAIIRDFLTERGYPGLTTPSGRREI